MTRLEIFKEMIGESHSEFVASSLKETYVDLNNELRLIDSKCKRTPIFDYDDEMEKEEILIIQEALEIVYSWYSCDNIKEIK